VLSRRLFFALILLGLCFSGRGTARGGEVEATRLPEFAGGVRAGAKLADPSIIYRISSACYDRYSSAPNDSSERAETCILEQLRHAGAGPQALAFARYAAGASGPAAIAHIHRHRVADAVYADLYAADISGAWFLIGRSGDVIPLWALANLEDDARFAAVLKRFPGASLWMPEGANAAFHVEDLPRGGQRFIFPYDLKTCHACASVGTAAVGFDFDAAGNFTGMELTGIAAASSAPRS
jgi:hypothetical protein